MSLRLKMTLGIGAILLVVIVSFGVIALRLQATHQQDLARQHAELIAAVADRSLARAMGLGETAVVQSILARIGEHERLAGIRIVDEAGRILRSSRPEEIGRTVAHVPRPTDGRASGPTWDLQERSVADLPAHLQRPLLRRLPPAGQADPRLHERAGLLSAGRFRDRLPLDDRDHRRGRLPPRGRLPDCRLLQCLPRTPAGSVLGYHEPGGERRSLRPGAGRFSRRNRSAGEELQRHVRASGRGAPAIGRSARRADPARAEPRGSRHHGRRDRARDQQPHRRDAELRPDAPQGKLGQGSSGSIPGDIARGAGANRPDRWPAPEFRPGSQAPSHPREPATPPSAMPDSLGA